MRILHGTWIPQNEDGFIQNGAFYLWVETTETHSSNRAETIHPRHLSGEELVTFLSEELGIKSPSPQPLKTDISPKYFLLPSADKQPLPSIELARYLETDLPETFAFQYWQVECYQTTAWVKTGDRLEQVNNVIKLLNDLHFLALNQLEDVQL